MRMRFSVVLLILLVSLLGCATIADTIGHTTSEMGSPGPHIYGGTRFNIHQLDTAARMKPQVSIIYVLDFPLSLALDTVLLPFTVVYNLLWSDGEEPSQKSP